jgi:hypothetical protein|tara:strand:+ start:321 stop:449 length:129 start_codon:yes stop_codon:yes gene_type:complete
MKEQIIQILKKHGKLQTNLASLSAQEQISREIIKLLAENAGG